MSVIQFWKSFHIKTAVNLLVDSWRELTQVTVCHAWQHKLELPVSQQQFIKTVIQQAVESARQVVGLSEVNKKEKAYYIS